MSDLTKITVQSVSEFTALQWGLNLQAAYERIAELTNCEKGYEELEQQVDELLDEKQTLEEALEQAEDCKGKLSEQADIFQDAVQTFVTAEDWEKIKTSFDYVTYRNCISTYGEYSGGI